MVEKKIVIQEVDLMLARNALATFQQCNNGSHCFFGDMEIKCLKGHCFLPVLRRNIEEVAPALMLFLNKGFNYDRVVGNAMLASIKGSPEQKEEMAVELADLLQFTHFSFYALFTSFAANEGRIPNISLELIEIVSKNFSFEETVKRMDKANHVWPYLIQNACFEISIKNREYYRNKIFLIIEVVLRAIEQLENEETLENEEMVALIEEIDQYLRKERA